MSNSKLLFVSGISEVKLDKNEREYKTIQVTKVEHQEVINPLTGKKTVALGNKRTSAFNAYKENYLGEMDLGWESKVGQALLGDLVSRNTTDYEIESDGVTRTVSSATAVVIGDSNDDVTFEKNTQRAFASAAFAGKDQPLRFELIEDEMDEVSAIESSIEEMAAE